MRQRNKQIKLNIPLSNKNVLEFCDYLSKQRMLGKVVIRLLQGEMQRRGYGEDKPSTNKQQSIFTEQGAK